MASPAYTAAWLPSSVPIALLVSGLALPAIGACAYRSAGRQGGGWVRILLVFCGFMLGSWALFLAQAARGGGDPPIAEWPFAVISVVGTLLGVGFAAVGARALSVAALDRRRQGRPMPQVRLRPDRKRQRRLPGIREA